MSWEMDRRIRPIYDMIDSRNFKGALKAINNLLQKYGNNVEIKMLKALILERLGKFDESILICDEIRDDPPMDEKILNDLYHVYLRLGRLHDSTISYENICSKYPSNLDLQVCLFSAYVREYNFIKQQQVAMKLYKNLGEEKFLMWSVCCIDLQVQNEKESKLFELAEALIRKRIETKGVEELESLLIYLNLLERQNKYSTALDVLNDGKLNQLFSIHSELLKAKGVLCLKLFRFKEAKSIYEELLNSNPDDWDALLNYFHSIFEFKNSKKFEKENHSIDFSFQNSNKSIDIEIKKIKKDDNEKFDVNDNQYSFDVNLSIDEFNGRVCESENFLSKIGNFSDGKAKRGPFLAQVELKKIKFEFFEFLILKSKCANEERTNLGERVEECYDDFQKSIINYYDKFGHMMCFSSDLKNIFPKIKSKSFPFLFSNLISNFDDFESKIGSEITNSDQKFKNFRKKIAAFQIFEEAKIFSCISNKGLFNLTMRLCNFYFHSLYLSSSIEKKEKGYGEEVIIAIANNLIEMYKRTKNGIFLNEAVLVLEYGLSHRPYSPQLKIMLINLCCNLGYITRAYYWFKRLEVKYIQYETLSHLILPFLLNYAFFDEANIMHRDMKLFYDNHMKDAADLICLAFKYGTYSKVREFVEFKERLNYSYQRNLMNLENFFVNLKKITNLDEIFQIFANSDNGNTFLESENEKIFEKISFGEDFSMQSKIFQLISHDSIFNARLYHGYRTSKNNSNTDEMNHLRKIYCLKNLQKLSLLPRLIFLSLNLFHLEKKEKKNLQNGNSPVAELHNLSKKLFVICFEDYETGDEFQFIENYIFTNSNSLINLERERSAFLFLTFFSSSQILSFRNLNKNEEENEKKIIFFENLKKSLLFLQNVLEKIFQKVFKIFEKTASSKNPKFPFLEFAKIALEADGESDKKTREPSETSGKFPACEESEESKNVDMGIRNEHVFLSLPVAHQFLSEDCYYLCLILQNWLTDSPFRTAGKEKKKKKSNRKEEKEKERNELQKLSMEDDLSEKNIKEVDDIIRNILNSLTSYLDQVNVGCSFYSEKDVEMELNELMNSKHNLDFDFDFDLDRFDLKTCHFTHHSIQDNDNGNCNVKDKDKDDDDDELKSGYIIQILKKNESKFIEDTKTGNLGGLESHNNGKNKSQSQSQIEGLDAFQAEEISKELSKSRVKTNQNLVEICKKNVKMLQKLSR